MDASQARQGQRTAAAVPAGGDRLLGAVLIDPHLQRRLDRAILKQALRGLWLRTDGFRMTKDEQEDCSDLMLDAARWCFVDRHANHVFSFRQICRRSGIDATRNAHKLFTSLPIERRREIWRALRHYPKRHLPQNWQACQVQTDAARRPKGRRYL